MLKKGIAFSLIGVGAYDLLEGTNPNAAIPVVGDYLTQQIDLVLIGIGVAILIWL